MTDKITTVLRYEKDGSNAQEVIDALKPFRRDPHLTFSPGVKLPAITCYHGESWKHDWINPGEYALFDDGRFVGVGKEHHD